MDTEIPAQQVANDQAATDGKPYGELSEQERVERIPQQIFDFKKKAPAFLFSQDNLRTIKRYQKAVRLLPKERSALAARANFEALGLDLEAFWSFHEDLRQHADAWDGVEDGCKTLGGELQVFAENFVKEGGAFIKQLRETQAYGSRLTDLPSAELPGLPLSEKDSTSLKEAVDLYLTTIHADIEELLKGIRQVKKLVASFSEQIDKTLQPKAMGLLVSLEKEKVDGKIALIGKELIELNERIEKKTGEYDALVGTAFFGIAFGPLGLAITGGIYGAQAEAVRAEKNELIEKRNTLAERQEVLTAEIDNFLGVNTMVSDINFRLVEVRAATKNLEDVWVLLESYTSASIKKAKLISSDIALKKFIVQFERVVSPWEKISDISKQLSALFNDVLDAEKQGVS